MNDQQVALKTQQALFAEQVRLLYAPTYTSLSLSLLNALILFVALWSVTPPEHLLIWFAAMGVIIIGRLLLNRRFQQQLPVPDNPRRWYHWFLLGAFATGSVWGLAGLFLFPSQSPIHQAFLAFVLAGMAAAAVTTLSWIKQVYPIFLLPLIILFALRLCLHGEPITLAMALMVVFYAILLLRSSESLHRTTTESIQLRLENSALVRNLTQANESLRLEQVALAEAERDYRNIFETVNEGIYLSSVDGRMLRANPALVRLNGYSSEDKLLAVMEDISREWYVDPQRRPEFQRLIHEQGYVDNFISEIYRHDTRECIWISENARAIRDDNGGIAYYQGTVRDITEQKKAEQALIEAKESAERTARLKSEFMATISHEIRTPMHGVLGMAELLLGTQLDDKQQRYTKVIRRSGELLLRIINDILDFSKLEAGKLTLEQDVFNLPQLLSDIRQSFQASAAQKGLAFRVHPAPELPTELSGDAARLRQILTNLIGNAIKFTEQGEVMVNVNQPGWEANGIRLQFEIHDSGPGIPAEAQNSIFESFVQVDGSYTRQHQGTGLGLAICKQLVTMMDGDIGVDSTLGKGSTFWFNVLLKPPPIPKSSG